jgi:hypothetical protein
MLRVAGEQSFGAHHPFEFVNDVVEVKVLARYGDRSRCLYPEALDHGRGCARSLAKNSP